MPYPDPDHMLSPLARARGHGSAHSGTHHWWLVKATALVLIPLTLWFFFSVLCLVGGQADYAVALSWVQKPYNALLMILFLGALFYHAALAGQEIIIDYVPSTKIRIPLAFLYRVFCYASGILGIFSVLYITFKL